jgi:hypothetical protein
MDSLKDIISDIRIFLYGGIRTLPITLAGTLLILGLMTANYAILFFLIGFLIVTPVFASANNLFMDFIVETLEKDWFKTTSADVCKIVIPYTTSSKNSPTPVPETVFSSIWTAMTIFFTSYVFTNGLELYNRQSADSTIEVVTSDQSDIDTKVAARTSQAIISMISVVIFAFIVIGFRYYSGCETVGGIFWTTIIFGFLGNVWYSLLSRVGQDRLSDLFGIANRLLPPSAITNQPIACIPIQV